MSIFRASEAYYLIGRARSDKSQLSDAVKKYIRGKWLEKEKRFKPPVTAKQLTKGIVQEENAIKFYGQFIGQDLVKCDDSVEIEDYQFGGTCDIITDDTIMDIKCPWDASGFMEASLTKQYEWQLRAYMMLYDRPKSELVFCLMDIPDDLFEDEWRRFCWNNGIVDDSSLDAQEQRYELQMMYYYTLNQMYSEEERIKVYQVERDQKNEDLLKESLVMAMDYYESLTLNIKL